MYARYMQLSLPKFRFHSEPDVMILVPCHVVGDWTCGGTGRV